jgi:hypothetical protein
MLMTLEQEMPDVDFKDDKPMGPEWALRLNRAAQAILSMMPLTGVLVDWLAFGKCRLVESSIRTFGSRSGHYVLTTSRFHADGWPCNSRGVVHRTCNGKTIADFKRHAPIFWHEFIRIRDGSEFLLYGPDKRTYAFVDLQSRKAVVADSGTFCFREVWPSHDGSLLAVDGHVMGRDELRIYTFARCPGGVAEMRQVDQIRDYSGACSGWYLDEEQRQTFYYVAAESKRGAWTGSRPTRRTSD